MARRDWSDNFSDAFTKASDRAAQIAFEREKAKASAAQQAFENKLAVARLAQTSDQANQRIKTDFATKLAMTPSSTLTGMVDRGGDLNKIMRGVGVDGKFNPQVAIETPVGVMRQNENLLSTMKSLKSTKVATTNSEYTKSIADAIESGDQPPVMTGLYRYGGEVRGELAKRKFDLAKAQREWQAVQKTINGLNSTQQVRMRQALDSVEMSIPQLQELSDEFKRYGFKDVNWVTVNAALKGVGKQRDLATKYIGQINLMKDELAQGFMGGGVPSEQAFKLADQILDPFYGKEQSSAALKQLNYNLKIRKQAIAGITPMGIGGEVTNPKMTGRQTSSSRPPVPKGATKWSESTQSYYDDNGNVVK